MSNAENQLGRRSGSGSSGLDRHGRAYPTMLAGAPEVYAKRVASGMDPETAAGREQTFARRLAGSLVHDTARELLTGLADPDSAISHPQVESWARVAGPKACDFCVMLAGRGYVYTSRDTAIMADSGKRYHDHCSCGVAIGPAGTRSPTAEQQYRAWVADGSRTQWGAGARRAAARPSTIPPAVPHTPAELHKMADDLEKFAATVETRLPDAAATARKRAAELRAQATSGRGSGASIPEPRRGARSASGVPSPRAGGSGRGGLGGGRPPIRGRGPDGWFGRGRIPPGWPTSEKPADGGLPGSPIAPDIARPQLPRLAPETSTVERWTVTDYWSDSDEVDIADWLLAHGYTITRVVPPKGSGLTSPDSIAMLYLSWLTVSRS